jgi:hypothetical protein
LQIPSPSFTNVVIFFGRIHLDSLGFGRIEWMTHLPGKFRKSGLSLRMLRVVFCELLEPGNNFALPIHVRVAFLRVQNYERGQNNPQFVPQAFDPQ